MRILHFSDVHVDIPIRQVPVGKWFGKRSVGALNLLAGRGKRFAAAREKLAALGRFKREQQVDLVIFSGDYTSLGLEREFAAARVAVEPMMNAPLGYVNVPGNHDLYLDDVLRGGWFDRHFGDTLDSDLPQSRAGGPWPLVRMAGDHVAVVAVNSAQPNPLPWRSNGRIPDGQLAALGDLLAGDVLRDRFVFVVTHYAPRLRDGGPDRRLHGMLNADEFLRICSGVRRGAILCGHVHHRYHVRLPEFGPAIFCAGSATMSFREGLWLFDVDTTAALATPGRWNGAGYELDSASAVDA